MDEHGKPVRSVPEASVIGSDDLGSVADDVESECMVSSHTRFVGQGSSDWAKSGGRPGA